jgi:formylglycine-generating enzyme required for sulfatase activity
MRSSLAAATLLLIMGMFIFQSGCSSSQQPSKQSIQQKNEEITSAPTMSAEQLIEPPSATKLAVATPNKADQQSIEPDQQVNSLTNSIGMKLMRIPKGKFLMGSTKTELKRNIDELQHEVTISQNFYMGATEVTQAQWVALMRNNPSKFRFQGDKLPVETVSWDESVNFCKKLSELPDEKKAGHKYRLPTEAEWEYACRAETTTPFNFGSELNGMQANCDGTTPYGTDTKGPYLENTSIVGSYPANAWGLFDMHGNVWEWCSDWYGSYPNGSATDPSGPERGEDRVNRGGCSYYDAADCRSAKRIRLEPSKRTEGIGFRVVMTSSENSK